MTNVIKTATGLGRDAGTWEPTQKRPQPYLSGMAEMGM